MYLFDLAARITLDSREYERGLNDASGKLGGFGNKLKSGLATAAKIGGAAIGAAAVGVSALVKNSVDAYAKYEQLVGGLETMFEDLSYDVELNAQKAFKTAGLSANEYMETVMGFSASLNQSLIANEGNIARAADLSDQIVTDMADNANKMGTSMEAIQNAYAGFAKQNYTMLDNLKLGYGGTKQEMERLLADAEKLTGKKFDVSNFADIAEAIHAIQKELRISGISAEEAAELVASGAMTQEEAFELMGTTAKEANKTIEGSVASFKSAWKNLVASLGNDEADIGALIDNVSESAKIALGNIIPVASKAIRGVSSTIAGIVPIISEELPGLITAMLPDLLKAGKSLVVGIGRGFVKSIPAFVNTAKSLLRSALNELGLGDISSDFMSKITGPVSDAWEKIKASVTDAVNRIKDAISPSIDAIFGYITSSKTMENAANFTSKAVQALADVISFVSNAIATAVEKVAEFVGFLNGGSVGAEALKVSVVALVSALGAYKAVTLAIEIAQKAQLLVTNGVIAAQKLLNAVMSANPIGLVIAGITALVAAFVYLWNTNEDFRNFWITTWEKIRDVFTDVWTAIKNFFTEDIPKTFNGIIGFFKELPIKALQWGKDLIKNFIDGIKSKPEALKKRVVGVAQTIKDFIGFSEPKEGPLSNFHTYAPDMMELFAEGIRDNEKLVTDQLEKSFDFGVKIPSFETNGGNNMRSYQNNSVVVNVYGAEGQNAKEIAKEVERIIANNLDVKKAVWA